MKLRKTTLHPTPDLDPRSMGLHWASGKVRPPFPKRSQQKISQNCMSSYLSMGATVFGWFPWTSVYPKTLIPFALWGLE